MIKVSIMIEGQNGLNWRRWQRIARAVEDLGYDGLYRSDHFTNAEPPEKDSLECWISLAWLASHTQRIRFGPLVSPAAFRHPAMLARMAAAVDDLSGGRLSLGLGAGWQRREHHNFGFDLLSLPERFARFEEAIQVISALLQSDRPVEFHGRFYQLHEAILLPRPNRPAGPPITIGGNGPKYTLPLAARYASEWNCFALPPDKVARLNEHLDELLVEAGRRPAQIRRSMMTGVYFGKDALEVERKIHAISGSGRTPEALRQSGILAGTSPEIAQQLSGLAEAGVQSVMLQWLDLDDIDGLEALAKVIPNG